MERDLKQKRGLVGDQKKRLAHMEGHRGAEREKIVRGQGGEGDNIK